MYLVSMKVNLLQNFKLKMIFIVFNIQNFVNIYLKHTVIHAIIDDYIFIY